MEDIIMRTLTATEARANGNLRYLISDSQVRLLKTCSVGELTQNSYQVLSGQLLNLGGQPTDQT